MADRLVYQLKVTLLDTIPPIWRRIQVRSDINLRRFNKVLQIAMGWMESHLYEFRVRKNIFGPILPGNMDDLYPVRSDVPVKLSGVLPKKGASLIYTYDMGDGWRHQIRLEKILKPASKTQYPCCLDGARACPPEDCGGTGGYEDLLAILKNPRHPEHKEMKTWLEGCWYKNFDSEAFALGDVNKELKAIR